MKRLTLADVTFTRVAYLDDSTLLAAGYRSHIRVFLWDLSGDSSPQAVSWPQAQAVAELFRAHGATFLRRQGFWPDGEPLPPAFGDHPGDRPPILQPLRPYHHPFFHPDGVTAAFAEGVPMGYYHTRFHLRDVAGEMHVLLLTPGYFGPSGDFSPDGTLLALSNGMKVVWVWDVASRQEVCRLEQSDGVAAVAFLDNDRLAVAAGRIVRVWEVPSARVAQKYPAFRKYVEALAVAPDQTLFAAGCRDGTVGVWEAGGHERGRYDWGVGSVAAVAFAPNGQTAAVAGQTAIAVWDLD